jgi:cytosine/uracil/thiamine/allantoin permease
MKFKPDPNPPPPPASLPTPRRGGAAIFLAISVVLSLVPLLPWDAWGVAYAPRVAATLSSFGRWGAISGAVSGGLLAVLVGDYHAFRRRRLPTDYLYKSMPRLHRGGVSGAALLALAAAYACAALDALLFRRFR